MLSLDQSTLKTARFFLQWILSYYKAVIIIVICLILEILFYIGVPFSLKFVIDLSGTGHDQHKIILILSSLVLAALIIIPVSILRDYTNAKTAASLLEDFRKTLYEHIEKVSVAYCNFHANEIMTHFSSDMNAIEGMVLGVISRVLMPIMSFFMNVLFLLYLNWKLAVFAVIAWPFVFIVPRYIMPKIQTLSSERKQVDERLFGVVYESTSLQSIIRVFNLSQFFNQKFGAVVQELANKTRKLSLLGGFMEKSGIIAPLLLQIILFCGGAYLIDKKQITVGSFVAFNLVFATLIYTIINLSYSFSLLMEGFIGFKRLGAFLTMQDYNKTTETVGTLRLEKFQDAITLQNIHFAYDITEPNHLALKDINLTIHHGQYVAFVGSSGSGKSTIFNLLMQFYMPTEGQINIDGINIKDILSEDYRKQVGCVFQDPLLFNMSIRDNILMGNLNATDAEIEKAAKAAAVHDVIMQMKEGYQTPVGERGLRLSGGQRQRIAIARALVRNPAILFLDEITSALDAGSAAAINETIKSLTKTRTIVTITHHLHAVMDADKIFLLKEGKLCEQGTHKQLLSMKGEYYQLWSKQAGFIREENDQILIDIDRLRAIPLFKILPENLLEKCSSLLKTFHFPQNEVVFDEGEIGDIFYIIARGKVGIFKGGQQVKVLETGDYFGEVALLKSIPRTAQVITLEDCSFLAMRNRDLSFLLKEYPPLRTELEKIIILRTDQLGKF